MRTENNIIKYVFALFVFGIIIATIYFFIKNDNMEKLSNKENQDSEPLTAIQNDLRLAISEIDTMNPILSNNRNVHEYTNLFYSSLVTFNSNFELKMDLAESIIQVEPLKYKIILKDGYMWQGDNGKVTADDVRFTIERINANKNGVYSSLIKPIKSVTSVNEREILIDLKYEDPFFEYNLTFPITKKVDVEMFKDKEKYPVPISSGKYIFIESSNNVLLYEINKDYDFKGENPTIKNISVIKYDTMGEAYNAFKSGNIDIITTKELGSKKYVGNSGYTPKYIKGRDFEFLAFNVDRMKEADLRKGISQSIDFNKVVLGSSGLNQRAKYPLDYGSYLYSDLSKNMPAESKLEYNLAAASNNLAKIGYKYNTKSKKYLKDDDQLEFTVLVNEDNSGQLKIAEALKSTLSESGIKLNINKKDKDEYYKRISDKNYDSAIIGIRNDYSPDLSKYLGDGNYSNYNNEEVKAILNQSSKEPINSDRPSKLLNNYRKVEEIYLKDMPFVGLVRDSKKLMLNYNVITPNNETIFNMLQNIEKWFRK